MFQRKNLIIFLIISLFEKKNIYIYIYLVGTHRGFVMKYRYLTMQKMR